MALLTLTLEQLSDQIAVCEQQLSDTSSPDLRGQYERRRKQLVIEQQRRLVVESRTPFPPPRRRKRVRRSLPSVTPTTPETAAAIARDLVAVEEQIAALHTAFFERSEISRSEAEARSVRLRAELRRLRNQTAARPPIRKRIETVPPPPDTTFHPGDQVMLISDGRAIPARVDVVSPDGQSLMLAFDDAAVLHVPRHRLNAERQLAVMRGADGHWREMLTRDWVELRPA